MVVDQAFSVSCCHVAVLQGRGGGVGFLPPFISVDPAFALNTVSSSA